MKYNKLYVVILEISGACFESYTLGYGMAKRR